MPKATGLKIELKFCSFYPIIITGWMSEKYAHTTDKHHVLLYHYLKYAIVIGPKRITRHVQ